MMNIAEISSSALIGNVERIRALLNDGVKICAVVKANAYGHGATKVSSILYSHVDCFAVALIEEAVELRLSGIDKQILLLLPTDFEGYKRAIAYNVTPTVTDFADIDTLLKIKTPNGFAVHLKVNTGMNRFGFSIDELDRACELLLENNIILEGCFSHFFNAVCEKDCDFQLQKFDKAKKIVSKYFPKAIYHISASGGILRGKKYNLDMVRPGLLLYGYSPLQGNNKLFSPVLKVKSKTLKSRCIKAGENLLYGSFKLNKDARVNIVRAGYADGFNRMAGNIINHRCMDVCAIPYREEEWVTTLDDASYIAMLYNGTPYEVLCGVTIRAHTIIKD